MLRAIALASLVVFAAGCTTSGRFALATEKKLYDPKQASFKEDQMLAKLPRGPRVSGKHCEHHLLSLIPITGSFAPDPLLAVGDALGTAGPRYDAIVDGELTFTQVPIPLVWRSVCASITGSATTLPKHAKRAHR